MPHPDPGKPPRVVLGEFQTDEGFRQAITTPVELIPAPGLADDQIANPNAACMLPYPGHAIDRDPLIRAGMRR